MFAQLYCLILTVLLTPFVTPYKGGATSTVNGSNVFVNEDVCFTINTVDVHAVCYGISPYNSNAMKSNNPHSGIYVAETSRTLDLNGGNPACNQGGVLVLERKCYAVDCRNGTIDKWTNGTLQAKSQGGYNMNSNNVVLVSSS